MAPAQKRKRGDYGDRSDRSDGAQRPSPHRPQNLNMAQHGQSQYRGGRGTRRGSTTHRGSHAGGGPRSPATMANSAVPFAGPANTPMSPPAPKPVPNMPAPAPVAVTTTTQAPLVQSTVVKRLLPTIFHYHYLTVEIVAAWQESGRAAIILQATKSIEDTQSTSILFQELVRAAIEERLPATAVGSTVKDILASEAASSKEGLAEDFLDTFSIVTSNPDAKTAAVALPDVPHPKALRELLVATGIPSETIRNQLELYILMACGFLRSTFERANIRYTTNELYRQAAFNLLREESEGYSKLLTEYFTTTSSFTNTHEIPGDAIVSQTLERVKSLIGAFDLDVGRVLDVTLDVFANSLVKHHKFFIRFLRASSWWPAQSSWDNVAWTTATFNSLPSWAEAGYDTSMHDEEEEKGRKVALRVARDIEFWKRVKEIGMLAWFELGSRRLLNETDKAKFAHKDYPAPKNEKDQHEVLMEIEDNNWIGSTGLMPPQSNRTAAQLLGFKLRFYASSARDPTDVLSDNLIYLAALLIKIGFISLRDLYPHLYPDEEEMVAIKEKLQKQKDERDRKARPGGGINALTMSGALPDDDEEPTPGRPGQPPMQTQRVRENATGASTPKSNAAGEAAPTSTEAVRGPKNDLPEPENQVYALLKSLLLIGAIPESLFIMGKYPWMINLHPELPQHIHRLLHHSLSKLWESLLPLQERDSLRAPKPNAAADQGDLPKGHLAFTKPPARKQLRWPRFEKENDEGIDYIFYWDHWCDNVPVCQTIDDVFLLCDTFLNISGFKIGEDPALLIKLVRIGTQSLEDDSSETNSKRWFALTKRLLVPSMSLVKKNPTVMREMWDLIKVWPTIKRYNIYAEWALGQTRRMPDIAAAVALASIETRDVMRRITVENAESQARILARTALSNPTVVFSLIFNQIECYENMISAVVKCCRNLVPLGYDVLTWSLMQTLGTVGKNRTREQPDGMLTSRWLQALAKFAGAVCFAYSKSMSSTQILLYVADQVKMGYSTDLEILQQIVLQMTGFSTAIEYTDEQIQLLAGGDSTIKSVLVTTKDMRNDPAILRKATHKTFVRQVTSLMNGEIATSAATQLTLAMAREIKLFPYRKKMVEAPLKVLSINLDKIFDIFQVFLETLRWNIKVEEFDQNIPDLVSLVRDHGVELEIAWMICRPSITAAVHDFDEASLKRQNTKKPVQAKDSDVEMGKASDVPAAKTNGVHIVESGGAINRDAPATLNEKPGDANAEMKDALAADANASVQVPTPPVTKTPPGSKFDGIHPALKRYVDGLKPFLPGGFEDLLSVQFYVNFWQLELRDIFYPADHYKKEHDTLSDAQTSANARDPATRTRSMEDTLGKMKALLEEGNTCRVRIRRVKQRTTAEKASWLNRTEAAKCNVNSALLQHCIFPRAKLSLSDAHYCFQMLLFLHKENVPGFRLGVFLGELFETAILTPMIFSCTVRETTNFARFLNLILGHLKSWHGSKKLYETEGLGNKKYSGFATKIAVDTWTPNEFLSHDEFRDRMFRWHAAISRALQNCLSAGEYLPICNAMRVLKVSLENFPLIDFIGKTQVEALTVVACDEEMQDNMVTAKTTLGLVQKTANRWVTTNTFKFGVDGKDKGAGTPKSDTRSNTPKPGIAGLNPNAKEFSIGGANGTARPSRLEKVYEDGEIGEDESKKDATKTETTSGAVKSVTATATLATTPATIPPATAVGKAPLPPHASHTTANSEATKPPPALASIPARPDNRPTSTHPSARPAHALPSRPDVGPLVGRVPERTEPHGRLGAPAERPHDRRERSPGGRRGRSRSPDRSGPPHYRDRRDGGYASHGRDAMERREDWRDSNRQASQDFRQPPREPPRLPVPPSDGRNRSSEQDVSASGPTMNPARAALINEAEWGSGPSLLHDRPPISVDRSGYPRSDRPQVERERDGNRRGEVARSDRESRNHLGSRTQSPRGEDWPPRAEVPRDGRRDDRPPERSMPPHLSSRDTPTGPRDDASRPQGGIFTSSAPSRAPVDLNHGRLSRDFGMGAPPRSGDANYGRLSTTNPAEVPSGPRGRNAPTRGGRNYTAPGGHGVANDMSPVSQKSPAHERPSLGQQVPFGANRPEASRGNGAPSAPQPPSSDQTPSGGIHPSRLSQIGPPAPSKLQTNNLPSSSFAPSGPRSARNGSATYTTGATTSPLAARGHGAPGAPSGPSNNGERDAREAREQRRVDGDQKSDKRFFGLHSILQQQPSPSFEPRGPPRMDPFHDDERAGARRRETRRVSPRSGAREDKSRDDGRLPRGPGMGSNDGPVGGSVRDSRRRDESGGGHHEGRESGHGSRRGRDEGPALPLPPPPPMMEQLRGGRGPPRDMDAPWGGANGDGVRRGRMASGPGGPREDQERRMSERKRGRPGGGMEDSGGAEFSKRLRRGP